MCSSAVLRASGPRSQMSTHTGFCVLSARANGQRVLRWICGQRSQGWRSSESSQDDSLREEQIQRGTAGARIAVLLFCGPAAHAPRYLRSQCQRKWSTGAALDLWPALIAGMTRSYKTNCFN